MLCMPVDAGSFISFLQVPFSFAYFCGTSDGTNQLAIELAPDRALIDSSSCKCNTLSVPRRESCLVCSLSIEQGIRNYYYYYYYYFHIGA